jgi:CxxC motif-containing protein (DUF1111 family)
MSLRRVQFIALFACLFQLLACGSDASSAPAEPDDDGFDELTLVRADVSDLPLRDLPEEWEARFHRGDAIFELPFRDNQGLGPVYIRQSCNSCHAADSRGPGAVRKMVLVGSDGHTPVDDQSPLGYGHTVRPLTAAGAVQAITVPEDRSDVLVTKREPPPVFARGYVEAVEDAEIERVAMEQAERGVVSGKINWVEYASESNPDTRFHSLERGDRAIGRFGLKARIATLDEFAADAFQGDMGITSVLRPTELPNPASEDDALPGIDIDIEKLNAVADYMRVLRIPKRTADTEDAHAKQLFEQTGCAECHVPALHTRADYPIAQLADIDAPIYTDLLLHDMGSDYGDGLREYDAGYSEWKTPPPLGLRHMQRYLHDGRAETIEQAIEMHGGAESEGLPAARAFGALSESDRAALLKFVTAL